MHNIYEVAAINKKIRFPEQGTDILSKLQSGASTVINL